jgi:hypothetical protein
VIGAAEDFLASSAKVLTDDGASATYAMHALAW